MAYSLLNQFYVPAELASVPYLVNKKNLAQANSLYFITQQSAVIFGFGIASILLGLLGYKISVFISSLMLFIAFISVNFINTEKLGRKKTDLEKSFGAFFLHILEGYKHIKKDKYILAPLGLIVGLQVVLAIAFTNLPILADELFNTPVEYAGLLIVTPGGIGAAIAAYTIPKLLQKYRKLHVIKHAMQLMIFSLLILNFANGIFSGVKYLAISALGYSYISIFIPSQTFLQEQTPDKLRGRVFGNLWLLTTLFTILPLILTASIVEIFGVHLLVYLIGAGIFAVYLLLNKFGEKWMYRSY